MNHHGGQRGAVAQDRQRHRLALPCLQIREQRGNGMKGVSVYGLDGFAAAQPGLLRGRPRLHLPNPNGAGKVLGQHSHPMSSPFISGGQAKREHERVAAALHRDGDRLARVQGGAGVDRLPARIVHGFKAADHVARLKAGLGRGRTVVSPIRWSCDCTTYCGTSLIHAEVEHHQHKGQDEVGKRPGQADQHPLPAWMRGEGAGVVCRNFNWRAGRLEILFRRSRRSF